jgi:hypothetical protein
MATPGRLEIMNKTRRAPNISLQRTGLSVKHSARMKSRMLATEARR